MYLLIHFIPLRSEDLKFKYSFYLFKASSALEDEISNKATYGPWYESAVNRNSSIYAERPFPLLQLI
jgi:hypothetical protein